MEGSFQQSLKFIFADNSEGAIRGATLFITVADHPELDKEIPITQFGVEVEAVGFPVSWPGSAGNSNYPKWPSATNGVPTILSTVGSGTITMVRADVPGLDRTASTTDCSGSNPRINGVWPGDYLEFNVPAAVSAGSLIKIQFEGRISGGGIKHWRLEYLDGSEWRLVTAAKTEDVPADEYGPAETITYTHDMSPGGSADEYNKVISHVVRYENTTSEVAFRFIAASSIAASSGKHLEKPNTGSARLDNSGGEKGCDASITCVASGGEIKFADITVAGLEKDYILFDGTPKAPVNFTVTASDDFTVTADVPWLHIDEGAAGLSDEETAVKVSCDASTLSEPREGKITILAGVTRKVIPVIQSAAGQQLEPFISIVGGNKATADYEAGELTVMLQANVEVSIEADSWLTVTPMDTKAMVEKLNYSVAYSENAGTEDRTGTIRFYNETENAEAILTVTQTGKPSKKVYFKDNFEWLAPYTTAYKEAYAAANPGKTAALDPVGSNLASHDQPNLWNDQANFKVVTDDLYERGYIDLNPSAKTLYMQENYFKMGATNKYTGLQLPPCDYEGTTPVNVDLTFDWCAHMTGTGNIDVTTLVVELTGAGTCADSGTAISNEITTTQTKGNLAWQHATVTLVGVTSATRIKVYPAKMNAETPPNQLRWHFDNIMITESDYVPPVRFPVVWSFKPVGDDWVKGTDFDLIQPTGSYVYSDTHEGKLSVNRAGDATANNPTYTTDTTIDTRLLSYGVYKDDFWLFEVDNVKNPAGTYGITYSSCASGSGPKFFILEYSLDGSSWTDINTKTTSETMKDDAATTRDVTYTYALSYTSDSANEVLLVNQSFHLPEMTTVQKLRIRARVSDTMVVDRKKELNGPTHGGTNRIGRHAEITFTAD